MGPRKCVLDEGQGQTNTFVMRCVTSRGFWHTGEPCKNSYTDQDAICGADSCEPRNQDGINV